jgi:uncharacterized membrane protein YesL
MLSRILGNDTRFGRLMTKCGTLIVLNLLFALSSVPFVTIGAGLSALYHGVFSMLTDPDPIHPLRVFWEGFRRNFGKATLVWAGFVLLIALGLMDLGIAAQAGGIIQMLSAGVIGVLLIAVSTVSYLLPLLPISQAPLGTQIKLAIYTAVRNPLKLILVLAINVVPLVLSWMDEVNRPAYGFIFTFFWFALGAWFIGKLLLPFYRPLLEEGEDKIE